MVAMTCQCKACKCRGNCIHNIPDPQASLSIASCKAVEMGMTHGCDGDGDAATD